MNPRSLMRLKPTAVGLAYVSAGQVRSPAIGKDVRREPTKEDPSHGNIVGPDSTGRRRQLARMAEAQWVLQPNV